MFPLQVPGGTSQTQIMIASQDQNVLRKQPALGAIHRLRGRGLVIRLGVVLLIAVSHSGIRCVSVSRTSLGGACCLLRSLAFHII